MQKVRQSNFELLRIFAMVFILISHYSQHGLALNIENNNFFVVYLTMFLRSFGALGVQLFVLITGFFMIDKEFSVKKILKIAFDTIFYSYTIILILYLFFHDYITFTPATIYESLLPISTNHYWFVTSYLVLYICIPLLNTLFNHLEKSKLINYIIILGLLWFTLPIIGYRIHFDESNLTTLSFIYFIGAYLKRYGLCYSTKKVFLTICFSETVILAWSYICTSLHLYNEAWYHHLTPRNSIFELLISVSIFLIFSKLKIEYNHCINYFASSSFAVYLISENIFIRNFIWTDLFHCNYLGNIIYIILNLLVAIPITYIICTFIDKIKNKLIDNTIYNFIQDKIIKLQSKLIDKNFYFNKY